MGMWVGNDRALVRSRALRALLHAQVPSGLCRGASASASALAPSLPMPLPGAAAAAATHTSATVSESSASAGVTTLVQVPMKVW